MKRATYPNGRQADARHDLGRRRDNQNAALTVFRHFDSATVVKGLVGDEPKTAWVIDYPLLERIHYLLVAGYDVYGNVGLAAVLAPVHGLPAHRRASSTSCTSCRPTRARAAIDNWYRGAEKTIAGNTWRTLSSCSIRTPESNTEWRSEARVVRAPEGVASARRCRTNTTSIARPSRHVAR